MLALGMGSGTVAVFGVAKLPARATYGANVTHEFDNEEGEGEEVKGKVG